MPKDRDILRFAMMVGAKEPEEGTESYMQFRSMFPRSNYFFLKNKILIVKISRSVRPFWGVGEKYLNFLGWLRLLPRVADFGMQKGGFFSKKEVKAKHRRGQVASCGEKDGNYKINMPLPDQNYFYSPEHFLRRVDKI